MNINSLISSISPLGGRGPTPASSKPASSPAESASDTFTRSASSENRAAFHVYSRASASGTALKPGSSVTEQQETAEGTESAANTTDAASENSPEPKNIQGEALSTSEQEILSQLQKIDQSVHTHERAHLSAAGGYAKSGASYTYKRGPDGKNYAVGGEVQIDTSSEATPEATMAKMRIVRQAALAPADPSGQDQKVAAQATLQISKAAQELAQLASEAQATKQTAENTTTDDPTRTTPGEIYKQAIPAVTNQSKNVPPLSSNRLRGYTTVNHTQPSVSQGLSLVA